MVRGFAYPYGAYDDRSVSVLKDCGICYARTVNSTRDFHLPQDWLRLSATCHHNDPKLMELADRFVGVKGWWDPMFFYLWGHSYEFEACNNWNVLVEFAEKVSGKPDIWYATNIEVYDYCEAFSRLRFNTAMTLCVNPTASDLWFAYGEKEVRVPAGQTVSFLRGEGGPRSRGTDGLLLIYSVFHPYRRSRTPELFWRLPGLPAGNRRGGSNETRAVMPSA